MQSSDWSAQQLAEFLAVVSGCDDAALAVEVAVERAAEAVEAEIGALVRADGVDFSIGFRSGHVPERALCEAVDRGSNELTVDGVGTCSLLVIPVDDRAALLLARVGDGFTGEEANLARGMG